MRNKKDIRGMIFVISILISIPIVLGICMHIRKNNLVKAIKKDPAYAIATIIKYGRPSKGSINAIIEFIDKDRNLIKTITSDRLYKSVRCVTPGDHYLVTYNIADPEKCILLLDYPVKDSSDFNHYLREFKRNTPNLRR